jgi:hypothetical protein
MEKPRIRHKELLASLLPGFLLINYQQEARKGGTQEKDK